MAEVLVKEAIDGSVQAAVEVHQEVAGHKEPVRYIWCHVDWVKCHSQANGVQRHPGEDPVVTRLTYRQVLRRV